MAPKQQRRMGVLAAAMAASLASTAAYSIGFEFSGFVRYESAIRTSSDENPNNIRGNPWNGVPQDRQGGTPLGTGLIPQAVLDLTGLQGVDYATNNPLFADTHTKSTTPSNSDFNLNQLRGKFDISMNFNPSLQLYSSVRAIFDVGDYDNWNPAAIGSTPEGFNQGKPEFFEYDDYNSGGCLNPLELCGRRHMVDFTALYLDYTVGPALIRVGQQQVAWGQALFFRVFDVPNGLDLRRHLILDDALEEYADERVASPGVRVTYQVTNEWEVDAYGQMFVPSTYPNPNTPYNVIPAQFTIHETYSDNHEWEDFNYGLRLRGTFGQWGLQFIATQRWAHEGVFRWTESGAVTDVPGLPATGAIVAQTPLEVDPTGVTNANEWFTYAAQVRLDGHEGLNTLIREFPAANLLLGSEVTTAENAARELDTFFFLTNGLRGHLAHEYFQEEVFGAGVSYVVEASPGSILDQLIINLETSYIPDRVFTEKSLSRNYIEEDESVTALVMEKYHRWFGDFPATYMVFQALHRTEANLFGQHLGCQRGTGGKPGSEAASSNPDTKPCSKQSGGSTDLVLAFLQPFPNYIYRLHGALLTSVDGGLFVQGGFRWSPGNDITFDIFYNHIDGDAFSAKPNSNALQNIDWADEVAIRLAYQF